MESLYKADDDAGFLVSDLQSALSDSSAIESIIMLQLIEQAVTLQRKINEIIMAKEADNGTRRG